MRTTFLDSEDKQLVGLALEYVSAGKRIDWKELACGMRRKRLPKDLEQRLRALKRTYGNDLARFPPCFFPRPAVMTPILSKIRLLQPSQAERAIQDIYRSVSAAEIRQSAGKTDENAGELLPTAVSSVIQMIGPVNENDIFLDVGAGLGNIAAQFAIQTNANQCLGIEKRAEVARAGLKCVRSNATQLQNLRKVRVLIGDVLDTPLSSFPPFEAASIIYLNDFLFSEPAKLAVREELCHMSKARKYMPRCFLRKMDVQTNNIWSGQLEERASPYLYTLVAIGVANDVGDRGVGGGGLRGGSGEDGARDVGRGDAGVVVASEQVDVVLSEVLSVMAVAEKKVGHSRGHVEGMVKDIAASEITMLEVVGFVVVLVRTALDIYPQSRPACEWEDVSNEEDEQLEFTR
ncbi:hypothetical protein DVH05_009170 [Phytophthora capsici]|nr:hypothetical protein DVH05_018809 [Phytophthora capsici]KAG1711929.1 hypothetical protein DVH05_009170 [Phytophthora capsici]